MFVLEVVVNYIKEIYELIYLIGIVVEVSFLQEIIVELFFYFVFVEVKEVGGLECVFGVGMLNEFVWIGDVNFGVYKKFMGKFGGEQVFLGEFKVIVLLNQMVLFKEMVKGFDVDMVEKWCLILQDLLVIKDVGGVMGSEWFVVVIKCLNFIKVVFDDLIYWVEVVVDKDIVQLVNLLFWVLVFVVVVMFFSGGLVIY